MKNATPRSTSDAARWLTQKPVPAVMMGLLIAAAAASAIISIGFRHNDFLWHYRIGQGAWAGFIYADALGQPAGDHYPVGRALINMAMAGLPYYVARAVVWCLGILSLIVALRGWHRMANVGLPVVRQVAKVAGLLSALLLLPLVFRDMDDCGLQLILLAMLGLAGASLVQRQSWRCGFWLALAITYKTTPVLFVGYLLYKRRWKEPLAIVLFVLLFNAILPALVFGTQATWDAHGRFFDRALTALQLQDPSVNPVEPPKHQNFSLKPAIARYLMTFEPTHPLFIAKEGQKDSNQQPLAPASELVPARGFVQFFNLPPRTANRVVTGLLLALAGTLAWRFRRGMGAPDVPRDIAGEWAAVALLCALLSPLCWKHHLVLALPCLFLVVRAGLGEVGNGQRV